MALQVARRHADLVRKVVSFGGAAYSPEGLYPELLQAEESLGPEALEGTPWQQAYARVGPHPDQWPTLVARVKEMDLGWKGWLPQDIAAVAAPVLVVVGDADIVQLDHVVQLFRLLGGGVPGDLIGLPRSRLAVLPGTTHVTIVERVDWLVPMISEFLDAPVSETVKAGTSPSLSRALAGVVPSSGRGRARVGLLIPETDFGSLRAYRPGPGRS